MRQEGDYLLGYFAYLQTRQHAYYGGLLVTNTRGVPQEFRHSEGVKPTWIQTALYGDSLESSLGMDALAPALYGALTEKPDILLIDEKGRKLFGSFVHLHCPAALLIPYDDSAKALGNFLCPEGSLLEAKEFSYADSYSERIYAYIEEDLYNPIGTRALEAAQNLMNLFSPFERIRTALTEIAQGEPGHKA